MIASQNSLSSLSDSAFLKQLDALVQKEKRVCLRILQYLIEMDRRKLYAVMGYSSLFDFCVRHLKYSESTANRKIKAARCIRDFPEAYEMLEKNELDMCKLALISNTLTLDNKSEILAEIKHKSFRQIQAIIARFNPENMLGDRVRPVYIKKPVRAMTQSQEQHGINTQKKSTANVGGKNLTSVQQPKQVLEKKFKLEFAVCPQVMAKIEEAKQLLSKKYPKGVQLEKLLDALLDEYLDRYSPKRKHHRRAKKISAKKPRLDKEQTGKTPKTTNPNQTQNRHIPEAIKDQVYNRDRGRCAYVAPDGTRCGSKWNLEIDHIVPFALGGDHSLLNLRLLCAHHNKMAAEQAFGREFMSNKIRDGRRASRE